jgi:hypothetical protein
MNLKSLFAGSGEPKVPKLICGNCGTASNHAVPFTPGSILIELVLWCCFLLPGLIYSLWRLSRRRDACPTCKSADMLLTKTPRGQRVMREFAA